MLGGHSPDDHGIRLAANPAQLLQILQVNDMLRKRVWLLMAGRGFGKTRCGAEWVRAEVKAGRRRIALVAPTAADARNVMVEGASGILAISPDPERPLYEPSKRRLTWPNGAVATTYSAR